MSRTTVSPIQATSIDRGGDSDDGGRVSQLSSPHDDLNQRIIRVLQDDGRAAYDVIGQQLGVSGGTIRNRVARMREAGMLRIVAVVDPVAVDYESDAMLGIRTAPGVAPSAVAQRLDPQSCRRLHDVGRGAGSTCSWRSCATRKPNLRSSSTSTSTARPISRTSRS